MPHVFLSLPKPFQSLANHDVLAVLSCFTCHPNGVQMTNESILKDADGIYDEFATPEKAAESVKLKVGTARRRCYIITLQQ